MSSRAITVTLLTVIALVSLMPVIAKASFTQNGVTVYSPPYQGYTYQTNQTVTLNISAPSYPNALVTVNVYNPKDKPVRCLPTFTKRIPAVNWQYNCSRFPRLLHST